MNKYIEARERKYNPSHTKITSGTGVSRKLTKEWVATYESDYCIPGIRTPHETTKGFKTKQELLDWMEANQIKLGSPMTICKEEDNGDTYTYIFPITLITIKYRFLLDYTGTHPVELQVLDSENLEMVHRTRYGKLTTDEELQAAAEQDLKYHLYLEGLQPDEDGRVRIWPSRVGKFVGMSRIEADMEEDNKEE